MTRILHTSDWHLGARLGRIDRTPDHQVALRGLLEHAREVRPDLVLHTGDVFDHPRPSYPALRLGVRALARLAELAPVVVVAGNHDSPALLAVLGELADLAGAGRLTFVTAPEVVTPLPGVAVACMPFATPTSLVDLLDVDPTRWQGAYADGVRELTTALVEQAELAAGPDGIVLYAAHLHVDGARPARSERRITIGDDYAATTAGLARVAYAAFGHIHDPQLLPGGAVAGRYAGSLVGIDFGEATQDKHAVLVELDGVDRRVSELPLPPGRPLLQVDGSLAQVLARAEAGDLDGCIVKAVVDVPRPVPDLAAQLLEAAPGAALFDVAARVAGAQVQAVDPAEGPESEPPLPELLGTWLREHGGARVTADVDDVTATLAELLGDVRSEDDLGVAEVTAAVESALAAVRGT